MEQNHRFRQKRESRFVAVIRSTGNTVALNRTVFLQLDKHKSGENKKYNGRQLL